MKVYQDDLMPNVVLDLTDGGEPIDLTVATAIRVIGVRGTTTVFNRTVAGTAEGVVTMPLQAGDTATIGRIQVEVEVMWPGNKPQTFRPASTLDVVPDLA